MNDVQKGLTVWGVILGVGIAAGLGIGWKLWSPKPGPVATPQPAIHQTDGSQVLEVKPDPHAKPPHQIPHGATVEDVVHVTVQPTQPAVVPLPPSGSGASVGDNLTPTQPTKPPCPPVRVDLTLLRMEDGTRRVVASSPDGEIVGAVHIPVEAARPQPRPLKWAAGIDYTAMPWGDIKSIVAQRTWGPLTLGAHAGTVHIAPPGMGSIRGTAWGVTALVRF